MERGRRADSEADAVAVEVVPSLLESVGMGMAGASRLGAAGVGCRSHGGLHGCTIDAAMAVTA